MDAFLDFQISNDDFFFGQRLKGAKAHFFIKNLIIAKV